jgi:hypothetical protein
MLDKYEKIALVWQRTILYSVYAICIGLLLSKLLALIDTTINSKAKETAIQECFLKVKELKCGAKE